ncbi:hypothetical protein [Nocardia lijiangensis]|uniref:hypothetical protein n=1 Tax=Nocardia lijiangensis TaxID=299618 RepID=UPI003D74AEBC
MILATAFDVLAQVGNPTTPEPPPESEKYLQLVRYLTWFAILGAIALVVIGIPLIVVLVTRRSGRHIPGGPGGPGGAPGYGGPYQQGPGGPGGGGPANGGQHGPGGGGPGV